MGAFTGVNTTLKVSRNIINGKIKTNNAQVFANELIEAVPVLEDGYDDDRTVLVAAIWEKGTQKCGINIGRE